MAFDGILARVKKRHIALKQVFRPFQSLLSLCSAGFVLYGYFKSRGEITLTLLCLAALTLFLLYFATSISGIRLLIRRALALLFDLSLICVALFILVSWHEVTNEQKGDPLQIQRGEFLMLALWVVFLYFVIFDWRFNGSLGKRFLGLRVASTTKGKLSFCQSFIRNFLSTPLPVIAGVLLNYVVINGQVSLRRRFFG